MYIFLIDLIDRWKCSNRRSRSGLFIYLCGEQNSFKCDFTLNKSLPCDVGTTTFKNLF